LSKKKVEKSITRKKEKKKKKTYVIKPLKSGLSSNVRKLYHEKNFLRKKNTPYKKFVFDNFYGGVDQHYSSLI
jgi:hypothetical protein